MPPHDRILVGNAHSTAGNEPEFFVATKLTTLHCHLQPTMAIVHIPTQLRALTNGIERVNVSGTNLRQVIVGLDAAHPGLAARLLNDDGISPGLAVSIDGAFTNRGLLAKVGPESEIHFLPAIGGG